MAIDFTKFSPLPSLNPPSQVNDFTDWAGLFGKSAVQGLGEFVGMKPSADVKRFRAENPVAGLASELAGFAVPYVGWEAGLARAAPKFVSSINKIGNIKKNPFVVGAAREAIKLAPLELGVRQLGNMAVGDESIPEMLGENAVNLAMGAGIGGLLHGVLAAGGKRTAQTLSVPGLDINAPIPIQSRMIQKALDEGVLTGDKVVDAHNRLDSMRRMVRAERLPPDQWYVRDLGNGKVDERRQLNRLFRIENTPSIRGRRFVEEDFGNKGWLGDAKAAGLPDRFEDFGQHFRLIEVTPKAKKNAAGFLENTVTRSMMNIGDNWFMTREANDGLFLMARKVKGDVGTKAPGDKWLLFKTDTPATFVPKNQQWANAVFGANAWNTELQRVADAGSVFDALRGFKEKIPLRNWLDVDAVAGGKGAKAARAFGALFPDGVKGPAGQALDSVRRGMEHYVAPRQFQNLRSPLARYIMSAAQATMDAATSAAQSTMLGKVSFDPDKNALLQALLASRPEKLTGRSVNAAIEKASDADIKGFWRIREAGLDPVEAAAKAAKGEMPDVTPGSLALARELGSLMDPLWTEVGKAQKAAGIGVTKPLKGHYGLTRQWEGDFRIPIRAEGDTLKAIASGFNARAAQEAAREIVEKNPNWRAGPMFQASDGRSVPKDIEPLLRSPSYLLERHGIKGYRWNDTPFTKKELLEAYESSINTRYNYQAELAIQTELAPLMARLEAEDPKAFELVAHRLTQMQGQDTPFSRIQNQFADKVLGPYLGGNSASKIASTTNSLMFHFQLAALKLSYPVTNIVGLLQTVTPEIAFLLNAGNAQKSRHYTYWAAGGTNGPVGSVGALAPLKIMGNAVRELRNPDAALKVAWERAAKERIFDPKFLEEFSGETAVAIKDIKTAGSSPEGFVNWLKSVSEFGPSVSERFGRVYSYTVGHMVGRDIMGLGGDALHSFASQFTQRTQYAYGMADRPLLFSTPMGSTMGLFKNWMMNYMYTMAEYTGEGFARGNWSPLAWQTATTAAVGGLAATPLGFIADQASQMLSDKSLMENTYEMFGQEGGDAILYGLPTSLQMLGLPGVSLYSQTATPAANPVRDASTMFSVALFDRFTNAGAAVKGAWDNWQVTGEHPAKNKEVREQMIRAFAPASMYRTFQAWSGAAIDSYSTGLPIMKGVSPGERMLYSMGFNPVKMDKLYAVSDMIYRDKEKRKEAVGRLGEAFATAQQERDNAGMRSVLELAMQSGVDPSSVLRSARTRLDQEEKDIVERQLKATEVRRFQQVLGTP